MKIWVEPPDVTVPEDLRAALGRHPLVATTLVRRGMADATSALAFLDPERYIPAPATAIPGLARAADRLERAIRNAEPVCIWGDFDVDGQTATALLVGTLRELGAEVLYHVPVRATESHGVNVPVLEELIDSGAGLLLTCDTGITSYEAIEYAGSRGVDAIITDHHEMPSALPPSPPAATQGASGGRPADTPFTPTEWPAGLPPSLPAATKDPSGGRPAETPLTPAGWRAGLPDAFAVVNPKSLPPAHPLSNLSGVGVAYKLAEELYSRRARDDPGAAARHLDLVALGIVADLAVQTGDTRYLLQRGLAALRQTRRPGLRLLMETAELDSTWLTEDHISYVLGPRLNAVGRLADANMAVELLTLGDPGPPDRRDEPARLPVEALTQARILVAQMEALNAQRKLMCDQVYAAAEAQIARDPDLLRRAALVLSSPAWPAGVIGIVASRLVERYGRPAVLIAAPPGQLARGSARSVEGLDITRAIAAHAGLLAGFGGHPMAAGLSIDPDRIPEFSRALMRTIEAELGATREITRLIIDGYLNLGELSLPLMDDLASLAPFGPGNPPLTLVSTGLTIENQRTVGRNNEHRLLMVTDADGTKQQVIWWDGAGEEPPSGRFDLAYTVRASDYRGERRVEVVWLDARPTAGAETGEVVSALAVVEVVDHRRATHPREVLEGLLSVGEVAVWREGTAATNIQGYDRYGLTKSESLAVWTAPPGPLELRAALARVSPAKVYLFGLDPGLDQPEAFTRRLAGLVKHALQAYGGRTTISALAGVTAQREATVRAGLEWLAARGHVRILFITGDDLHLDEVERSVNEIAARDEGRGTTDDRAKARLKALLAETAAYREYFRRVEIDDLLPPGPVQLRNLRLHGV